jgi:hypothetical protein
MIHALTRAARQLEKADEKGRGKALREYVTTLHQFTERTIRELERTLGAKAS